MVKKYTICIFSQGFLSILSGWQDFYSIEWKKNAFFRRHPLGNRFAVDHLQGRFKKLWTQQRVAFDRGIQLTRNHRFKSFVGGIDGYDLDVYSRFEAIIFNCFDS